MKSLLRCLVLLFACWFARSIHAQDFMWAPDLAAGNTIPLLDALDALP